MSDSRWLKTKKTSNWHFDQFNDTVDYNPICTFSGDWEQAIDNCMKRIEPNTWIKKVGGGETCEYKDGESQYCKADLSAVNDLTRAGAKADQEMFSRCVGETEEVFVKIAELLKLKNYEIWFQNQTSGQMTHMHIDTLGGKGRELGNDIEMRRFIVMLDDWQLGQSFILGNKFWQWRKGECLSWYWKDIPHGSSNFGYHQRPMLQITGELTEESRELLRIGSFKTTILV